jgi:hypothetical protein
LDEADGDSSFRSLVYIPFQRMSYVIPSHKFGSEDLVMRFPRVVGRRITLPSYQVLQLLRATKESMVKDRFDLVFLFTVYKFRGWSRVIDSVLRSLMVRGQQGSVEDVMDIPGQWQFELVRHGGYHFSDTERSMSLGG